MFKKKSLKFTYEKVSRDLRHAESLKARETSRFKRLSIVRSINDSDYLDKSVETPKENKFKAPEAQAIPKETFQKPSRLEMLFKWKQEKQIKKEMEKLSKKKPFYSGGSKSIMENKALQSSKSSVLGQSSSSSNSSKFSKSKLVTPSTIVQPSRIQNSRQGTISSSSQSSKLKQFNPGTSQSSKIPHSKQGTPGSTIQSSKVKQSASASTFQWLKNAVSKQTTVPKSGTNLSRSNSTATLSRKFPASAADKNTLPKFGTNLCRSNSTATLSRKFPAPAADKTCTLAKVTVSRSNSTAAVPRKFPGPSTKTDKAVSSKVQAVPLAKRTPHVLINGSTVKSDPSKPVNKGLMESRPIPKRQEEKSIKKTGISLPKFKSNAKTASKGIPVQEKIPISNMTKKFGSNPKLNQKEASQSKENIPSRKGYCFRTAIENSRRQKTDVLLKTPLQGTPKKLPEKISKNQQEKPITEQLNELSLDCIPDVTFNSDLSIIKPARPSFAPANFIFQPPAGLDIFDDDYDVYQDLEEVKLNFMSRTSTPSKSSGRKSSLKSSKESLGSNNPIADVEKTSNLSNSNDIRISELMTPTSFEVKIDNKEADKFVNKQTCNEVGCDITTNIEIKNVNTDLNQQASVKEADIAVNQKACEELASVSPVKTEFKAINQQTSQEITSDIKTDLNQEAHEELASISPVKVVVTADSSEAVVKSIGEAHEELASISPVKAVVTADSTEADVKNFDIVEQKCLFSEKQSFDDTDITENPKGNEIEKSNNEKHFNQSVENGTHERTDEDILFFPDDESLLDSIDLSKIMIKSDDEDSDEDDVPSLQIPKCSERKSNGAFPKRTSMLKRLSVMNSIAETNETECVTAKSPSSQDTKSTPRLSKRVSNLVSLDTLSYSPMKNSADNPNSTPRRSLRLMKKSSASDNHPVSPFQEKNMNVSSRRRSVRLIDLNTPEKAACQKLIGENFENLDPNNFLIDLESPTMPALQKSKKVSLLYSPERRKSIRKSIKGDLISFSPI